MKRVMAPYLLLLFLVASCSGAQENVSIGKDAPEIYIAKFANARVRPSMKARGLLFCWNSGHRGEGLAARRCRA